MEPQDDRRARNRSDIRLVLLALLGIALLWTFRGFAADPRLGTVSGWRFFSISIGEEPEPVREGWRDALAGRGDESPTAAGALDTDLETGRAARAPRSSDMNDVTGYLSSLFLSVAIALVVALVLRKPLGELLVELCGNQRRARFWAAFTSITLVLGAMLGTLLSIPGVGEPAWDGLAGLRGMLVGLRSGTFLLLLVIATMGFVMLIGISRLPAAKALEEQRG